MFAIPLSVLRAMPLLALAAFFSPTPVRASRLDKDACEALKTEVAGLVGAGVRDEMAKGPEWARSNLPRERLAGIQRLIEVEEQIAFRCERPRPPVTVAAPPTEAEEGGAPAAAKSAKGRSAASAEAVTDAAGSGGTPAKPKLKKVRKPKPASEVPAASESAAPATVPPTEAPVAVPARKKGPRKPVNDAYVPQRPAAEASQAIEAAAPKAQP